MLTFGSLFAGIGGIDLGLERCGMQCKWQVEIDDYARRVLAKHWPDVRRHDDIRTWLSENVEQVDLIVGGFPCTDISFAGRGAGIHGKQSGLFFELARVVREMGSPYVLLENVSAILAPGRGMGDVLGTLATLRYDAEWDVLPASAFGAHFRGERVFIAAHRSPASCLRRQGEWSNPSRAFARHEFERLVQRELQFCVPAGKDSRISDGVSNRTHRLRGLGNAVVPQVAEYIGRMILKHEEQS